MPQDILNHFLPDGSAPSAQGKAANTISLSSFIPVDARVILDIIRTRKEFSHKGTYGHVLLIAGSKETMGAALLSAKGCLYGGAGLTTVSIPEHGLTALNAAMPELMYLNRKDVPVIKADKYQAIAVGPGLGTNDEAQAVLKSILDLNVPLVIDADALSLLSEKKSLMDAVAEESVLTPHVKEFDRLFGPHKTWYARLQTAHKEARERNMVILLKNQYTFIAAPDGRIYINTTGNPGMAQGGMGDVLTGLIASYVAQGYSSTEAAIYACYAHGKSGDQLCETRFNVTASQVAENIPKIVLRLFK